MDQIGCGDVAGDDAFGPRLNSAAVDGAVTALRAIVEHHRQTRPHHHRRDGLPLGVPPPRPVRRRAQDEVWQPTGAGPARCALTTKRESSATQRGFTRGRWNCADTPPSTATMELQDQPGKSSPVTDVN